MLDVIPDDFFKNPNVKVLEPCAGKGGFLISIFLRFYEGLREF
jgi:hypothetical protein